MKQANKFPPLPNGFKMPHILSGMPADTPILVAYSGGADSGALLNMTLAYAEKSGARVCAAHINHGIRGAEADRDEEFCRKTAEKYGIEIFVLRADVPAIARERKKSVETAAREVRYEFFSKVMLENNIPLLCVAHNADDNFETILFNISRGSGLSGVCGIPRTRDIEGGVMIRPILEISKADINSYCSENNIEYVTDSTNLDNDYTRNRIRNRVIPELKAICPAAENAAARLSESLREDALCLDSMAEWFLSEAREGFSIPTEKLCGSPSAISSRAVMSLFFEFSGGCDLEYTHVKAILDLAQKAIPHSSLDLPSGVRAEIDGEMLRFTSAPVLKTSVVGEFSAPLSVGVNTIPEINARITLENTQNQKNIYKKSMNLLLDFDKIMGSITARCRLPGDKLRMNGMGKSIKKMMCDKKLPLELRSRIPVICDDSGVLAVPLLGVRDGCAPTEHTKRILRIELELLPCESDNN